MSKVFTEKFKISTQDNQKFVLSVAVSDSTVMSVTINRSELEQLNILIEQILLEGPNAIQYE
jgi:hypothetical protein